MPTINNVNAAPVNPISGKPNHITRSGMSDVYKVWDSDGWHTIKMARTEIDGAERSLRDEALAYQDIGPHPNIVTYQGCGTVNDRFYLQLEHLDESQFLTDGNTAPMEEARVVQVARGVSAALAHIHNKGYVHRDVKPDNIWVGNVPMLFDFGLAENVGLRNGWQRVIHGTPSYMTPAHLLGEPRSFADDLFALGLTLYNMRTGHDPFDFAMTWDWQNNGFDRYYKTWVTEYSRLRDTISEGDHSKPFKSLLQGLIHYFDGGGTFHHGTAVANFLSRSFPSA